MSKSRIPRLTHHKASGHGIVRLNGKDFYLGQFGTTECEQAYRALVSTWLANGCQPLLVKDAEPDLTINELVLAFLRWADGYYCKPSGEQTKEPECLRLAVRPLVRIYGSTAAASFGPLALRATREEMIREDLCRGEINRRVSKIRRVFRWGAGRELVPVSVHQSLQTVEELRRGRSQARESKPVTPVPEAFVLAVLPYVSRQVAAMIRLQVLSGARPGELCVMRSADIDVSGDVWIYSPADHKTAWRGKGRRIYLGPEAQKILREWLRPELTAYLFQPCEAEAERKATLRTARKTPVQPSQRNRKKARPRKQPGERYDTASYRRSIDYAIERVNKERAGKGEALIPKWHPHQLRHLAATRLQSMFGWDVARAMLGHDSPDCTKIYVERDERLACEAALRIG